MSTGRADWAQGGGLTQEAREALMEVRNLYEKAVLERLACIEDLSADEVADAACLALSRLPAWYVRHSVDARSYMTSQETADMDAAINQVVEMAVRRVRVERHIRHTQS